VLNNTLIKKIILPSLFAVSLYATGEAHKGQTFYYYLLKSKLGYDGSAFAKQHTDKQWIHLFQNNSKDLKIKLLKENTNLKSLLYSKKFDEISPHLEAFVIEYASNKKNAPVCIE